METASKQKTVCVVEDDQSFAALFSALLPDLGCELREFATAEAALSELPKGPPPDILITDFTLPRMDGTEFLSRLYASIPEFRGASKVVGLSGHRRDARAIDKFVEMVDVYSEKPRDLFCFESWLSELVKES